MTENYAATLTDPRWQRKKCEILMRDNFACVDCDAVHKTLHIHHIRYLHKKEPWEYPDNLLKTVCWECHEKYSDKKFPKKKPILGKLTAHSAYRPARVMVRPLSKQNNNQHAQICATLTCKHERE